MTVWSYHVSWLSYILFIIIPLVDAPDQDSPLLDIKKSKVLDMYCRVPYFNTSVTLFSIHFKHETGDTNLTLASISDQPAKIELQRLKSVAKVNGSNPESPEDWYLRLEMPPEETNGTYICVITFINNTSQGPTQKKIQKIKVDVTQTGAIHIDTANQPSFTISQRDVHLISIAKEKQVRTGLTHLEICQARLNVTSCQAVKTPQEFHINDMHSCSNYTMEMDTNENEDPKSIFFDVEINVLAYRYFYSQGSNQYFFQPEVSLLCNNTLKEQNENIINSLHYLNNTFDETYKLLNRCYICIIICTIAAGLIIVPTIIAPIYLLKEMFNKSNNHSAGNKEELSQISSSN